jgi:hypothetical protein
MSTVLKNFGMRDVATTSSVKILPTKKDNLPKCLYPENIAGIELEIECSSGFGHSKYFSRVTDGSLRNEGNEFISLPLRVDTLLEQLQEFFQINRDMFVPECYSDRTSTHVHMNVQHFTKENVKTLLLYYALVEPLLFDFVGNYRQENIYCVPLNETLLLQDMSKTVSNLFGGSGRGWQKYTALNLLPITKYGTVEFRHMHGTNDFDKLWTWINSLSNLISVSYNTPLEKCIEFIQKVEDSPYPLFNTLLPLFSYTDKNKELFNNSILYSKYLLASELKTVKKLPNDREAVIVDELQRNNDNFLDAYRWAGAFGNAPELPVRGVLIGAGGGMPIRNRAIQAELQPLPLQAPPQEYGWLEGPPEHPEGQQMRNQERIRQGHNRDLRDIINRLEAQQRERGL